MHTFQIPQLTSAQPQSSSNTIIILILNNHRYLLLPNPKAHRHMVFGYYTRFRFLSNKLIFGWLCCQNNHHLDFRSAFIISSSHCQRLNSFCCRFLLKYDEMIVTGEWLGYFFDYLPFRKLMLGMIQLKIWES